MNLSLPVRGGRPVLGTRQRIYLREHRHRPPTRHLALRFIGGIVLVTGVARWQLLRPTGFSS